MEGDAGGPSVVHQICSFLVTLSSNGANTVDRRPSLVPEPPPVSLETPALVLAVPLRDPCSLPLLFPLISLLPTSPVLSSLHSPAWETPPSLPGSPSPKLKHTPANPMSPLGAQKRPPSHPAFLRTCSILLVAQTPKSGGAPDSPFSYTHSRSVCRSHCLCLQNSAAVGPVPASTVITQSRLNSSLLTLLRSRQTGLLAPSLPPRRGPHVTVSAAPATAVSDHGEPDGALQRCGLSLFPSHLNLEIRGGLRTR